MGKYFILSFLVVWSILLFGCIKDQHIVESEERTHYSTYTDDSNYFSISYPPDWKIMPTLIDNEPILVIDIIDNINKGTFQEEVYRVFKTYPPQDSEHPSGCFVTIHNHSRKYYTLNEWVESSIQGTRLLYEDFQLYSQIDTSINGLEATIIDWEATLPKYGKARTLQMYTYPNKIPWAITCTSLAEDYETWENYYINIINSFKVTETYW